MQYNDEDQQNLTSLRICSTQNRIQIPQEEEDRPAKAYTNKRPIQRSQRTPTNQGDTNPDQIRVPVQRPALDQISRRATEPPQRTPQRDRENTRVSVDQARGAREKRKVIFEVVFVFLGEPL